MDPEAGTPASWRRAAEAAGVDWRTARRAWKAGWPGFKAIREVVESERVLARSALRREYLAERLAAATALATEDAVESRAQQGKVARILTGTAMNEIAEVHTAKKSLLLGTPEAKAERRARQEYAAILRTLSEVCERGQRIENLVLGTPTAILGGEVALRPVSAAETTPEQAEVESEALRRAIEYAREQMPEPKLIEGGNGADGDGSSKPN